MKKVGILGGTFNPVHLEHIALAKVAVSQLNLDKLIVMPTYISPHKDRVPAPEGDRLNMLRLAFQGVDKVEISDYEILKKGKSYTYQTVEYFNQEKDIDLYFIVGGDMLNDFKNWKYPERILSNCNLAVFDREGVLVDYKQTQEYFLKRFGKTFIKLSYVGKDASSTKIRIYSEFSLPLEGLTTKEVEQYILDNKLYQGGQYAEFIKKHLPEKRVRHTANVVVCALQKVKELNLSEEQVKISATLHDLAKYIDYRQVQGFVLPEGVPEPVVHSFLGAYIAQNVLGVKDEEIIDAIRYHTSGKPNMSTLGKLIFVADMIEEGRDYQGVEQLRELYQNTDFNECFKKCLEEEVIHLLNKKQNVYVETLDAYDYYIKNKKEGN